MLRKSLIVAIALFGLSAAAPRAGASPISCPGTLITTDREFTLNTTPSSTCRAAGVGNLNGNNDYVNDVLDGLDFWTTIDKSDDAITGTLPTALTITGSGTLAGTFSFSPTVWSSYDRLIIAFKAGEGQLDPDWAAFELPNGVFNGSWSISGNQTLSHANLYGHISATTRDGGSDPVPEPATLGLFGSGLALAARQFRRRKP